MAAAAAASEKESIMDLLKPGADATPATVARTLGGRTAQAATDAAVGLLSVGKQKQLWECLAQLAAEVVGAEDFAEQNEAYAAAAEADAEGFDSEDAASFATALRALRAAAATAHGWAKDKSHSVSGALFTLAETLHAALFVFKGPAGDDARMATLKLCATLWEQRRKGAEALTTHTLPCLLLLANDPGAADADVKRCHSMREALPLVDMDDESAAGLKDLLAQCFINPAFLRSREGRGFLQYVAQELAESALPVAYSAVLNQLPYCHASELTAYGNLFLRAWTAAEDGSGARAAIEDVVLQDLVVRGVTAARSDAFKAVRRVLEPVMRAKKISEVDAMVARIYGPVIWRGIEAASPAARRNSLALLVDAFPVADPTSSKDDFDSAMQRNFTAIYRLLADASPAVRAAAAQGTCRILSSFWELVPAATTKRLLARVAGDCARDASSVAVRSAAVDGVAFLLDQVLAHPLLASLLPAMSPLVHDRSERVRSSVLQLLLKVQCLRSIRLYDVVPADDIMARLVLDAGSDSTRPALIRLLAPSFLPPGASASDLITRVVRCMRRHPAAGVAFFANAGMAATAQERTRLALVLHKALVRSVESAASGKKAGALDARNHVLMAHLTAVFRAVWAGLAVDVLGSDATTEGSASASGASAPASSEDVAALRAKLLAAVTPKSLLSLLEGIVGSAADVAGAPDAVRTASAPTAAAPQTAETDPSAAAAASLLAVAATLGGAASEAVVDGWAWPVIERAPPGSRLHAAAVDALCGLGRWGSLVDRCETAIRAAAAATPTRTAAARGPVSSLMVTAEASAALGSGFGASAAVAALDRLLAVDPSGARAALVADEARMAALTGALDACTGLLSAELRLAMDAANDDEDVDDDAGSDAATEHGDARSAAAAAALRAPLSNVAAASKAVGIMARLSVHAAVAAASAAAAGEGDAASFFAAGPVMSALVRWIASDVLPVAGSVVSTLPDSAGAGDSTAADGEAGAEDAEATAALEAAAVPARLAAIARANVDAAAAVTTVLADCVSMGSGGDAACALLRAVQDAASAAAVTAVPPPPACLYAADQGGMPSSVMPSQRGRGRGKPGKAGPGAEAGDRQTPGAWSAAYAQEAHGGSLLVSAMLRLAARVVASANSPSGLAGAGLPGPAAGAGAAAALALLASASRPRVLCPTLEAAGSAAAVRAMAARQARRAGAVWAGCVRRMSDGAAAARRGAPAALAAAITSVLPGAVRAAGGTASSVGEAFAVAAAAGGTSGAATTALSGVHELGLGLRSLVAPLLGRPETEAAFAGALATGLRPALMGLVDAAKGSNSAAASRSKAGAGAPALALSVRSAAALKGASEAALPWLALLSAAWAEQDGDKMSGPLADALSLGAQENPDSAGLLPIAGLLKQAADATPLGPVHAVAAQIGERA
ncbi:hypothetical protein FNF31_00274 [Cafeteria roenbergensis]|uniref:Uncharacterized protein n=1 Tax=Cafeteria roenbergensis TaxID=33653 RepID=A0A5A8DSH0_CAFRO|nr:hypothetical protein FNF28_03394 [Cafeteria roenbergensis]KAA0168392.1 hypothetical protein FNF31_00274 [Cafeteria roenbergensis]